MLSPFGEKASINFLAFIVTIAVASFVQGFVAFTVYLNEFVDIWLHIPPLSGVPFKALNKSISFGLIPIIAFNSPFNPALGFF